MTIFILNPAPIAFVFEFMAMSLWQSLKELNYDCQLVGTLNQTNMTNSLYIIFASHSEHVPTYPPNYIVFNYEQLAGCNAFARYGHYEKVMRGALCVWDYSLLNVEFLNERKIKSYYIPFGYSPALENHQEYEKEGNERNNVLFFGSGSERREKIVRSIRDSNINITYHQCVFGPEYWRAVKNSKIVLNIHYYTNNFILEQSRIVPLVANKKLVISEYSNDITMDEQFKNYIVFCTPEDMPSMCRYYLENDKEREEFISRAYDRFVKEFRCADHLAASGALECLKGFL